MALFTRLKISQIIYFSRPNDLNMYLCLMSLINTQHNQDKSTLIQYRYLISGEKIIHLLLIVFIPTVIPCFSFITLEREEKMSTFAGTHSFILYLICFYYSARFVLMFLKLIKRQMNDKLKICIFSFPQFVTCEMTKTIFLFKKLCWIGH